MACPTLTDEALRKTLTTDLTTAVVGDVLDRIGYHHQFLPHGIAPLLPGDKLVGRALPVWQEDLVTPTNKPDGKPFGLLFEALDDLKEGEVYVASGEGSKEYALFGGLMSTRAKQLKAAGAVLDGYVRDSGEIQALGFSIFSRGLYAQDQGARGKVTKFRVPIKIGSVEIQPGDLIFADAEGVLVIPQDVEQDVVERALEKASTENKVEQAIKEGMSASAAFSTFGVF
jgi:4-hydroxy-4-methyl-2-oxoglutarate aldolase